MQVDFDAPLRALLDLGGPMACVLGIKIAI